MMDAMDMHFSIAGFFIKIRFDITEWPEKRALITSFIDRFFNGFLCAPKKTYDCILTIKEIKGIPYVKSNGHTYARYFRKVTRKEYQAYYHISPYEFSQLLQIIIIDLLGVSGFVLHASSVLTRSGAVLFAGPSGAGKSTILQTLSGQFVPLADDSIIIRKIRGKYMCFQSPHIDKNLIPIKKNPYAYPIRYICALKKHKFFSFKNMHKISAVKLLMQTIWSDVPMSKIQVQSAAEFINSGQPFMKLTWKKSDGKKIIENLNS